MDNLPHHCRENAITLKQNDYMNFETMLNGVKMSFKFDKIPNFYIVDNKECYVVRFFCNFRINSKFLSSGAISFNRTEPYNKRSLDVHRWK